MSDAFAIATSGLKCEEYYIDKIAHDLANLNTPNYKASKLIFEDVLYQNIRGEQVLPPHQSQAQLGLGAALYQSTKDFSPGPLKASANWNDVAIDGAGFYQLITNEGTLAYTRNASFSIDADHYLASQEGLRLADNIQIPDDFIQLSIQANGDVAVLRADETEPQFLGTIQLAKFSNPEALNPIGSGLYTPSSESGDPITDNPGSHGLGQLAQNQMEQSNVDMVASLMQLTMAQRVYQLNAKAIQIADELEQLTIKIRD